MLFKIGSKPFADETEIWMITLNGSSDILSYTGEKEIATAILKAEEIFSQVK